MVFPPETDWDFAICHSMVNLLNGQIQVTSVPGQITTFEVTLPALAVTTASVPEESILTEPPVQADNKPVELENIPATYDPSKQTVVIIDDDPSMLWFISDLFAGKYNVLSFDNANKSDRTTGTQICRSDYLRCNDAGYRRNIIRKKSEIEQAAYTYPINLIIGAQ